MQITRRTLLALTAASAVATGLCAGGTALRWWDAPPGGGYRQLSDGEAAFVRSFGAAAFPGGDFIALDGGSADMDRFFDALLDGMEPLTADLLKLLLQALQRATLPTHGASFTALSVSAQQDALMSWFKSDIADVRAAVTSFIVLLGMGYTTHPDVSPIMSQWHRCGYGR